MNLETGLLGRDGWAELGLKGDLWPQGPTGTGSAGGAIGLPGVRAHSRDVP